MCFRFHGAVVCGCCMMRWWVLVVLWFGVVLCGLLPDLVGVGCDIRVFGRVWGGFWLPLGVVVLLGGFWVVLVDLPHARLVVCFMWVSWPIRNCVGLV